MKKIENLLKPYNIFKSKLRIGDKNRSTREFDGGYIVTNYELENSTALYTYGVGEDITADTEFYNLTSKPCYLYDHTIDGSVVRNSGLPLNYKNEGLGFTAQCGDFLNHYKENGTEGEVVLKIDVEGAEYDYFSKVDLEDLESKVVSLLIEFHHLDNPKAREYFEIIMNKLDKYFVLHHVHANNYGTISNNVPSVPELSFINRRHIDKVEESNIKYPIRGLDFPNTNQFDDICLDFTSGKLNTYKIKIDKIPNIFHFCYGLKEQTEEFSIIYYLCIKSCIKVNRPEKIHFYYHHEPYGKYWDKIKEHLTLIKVKPPTEIFGIPVTHYAHQADIIRMQALIQYGGIYADIDTVFINPYPDHLFQKDFVMGQQGNEGLCNALMMSSPKAYFPQKWLADHKICFKGTPPGTNGWCTHSVYYPLHLSKEIPEHIHIEGPSSFFNYLYHPEPLKQLFQENNIIPSNLYSLHLWETPSWEPYLSKIDEKYIRENDTTYTNIVKDLI
mgnify:FL=1